MDFSIWEFYVFFYLVYELEMILNKNIRNEKKISIYYYY